jgi:UDP-glucose 4-epimerase
VRCLVTGGAGFIGSHLVDALIENGHSVTVVDNLSVGRLKNIERHLSSSSLVFVEADISDRRFIDQLDGDFDWVFHLAALADIVPSIESPSKYFDANVLGTLNVAEFARSRSIKKFVYAASSSCYGIPDIFPTPENSKIDPQYPYALTKYLAEVLLLHWNQVYDLPVISLRFFNVYGPRARTSGTYGAVFGVFLAQKLAGKPMTIVGDGNQTRDFTFVSDICDALLLAAASEVTGKAFNVGSGSTYSINRLIQLIGGPSVHIPKRPGEPDCTFADISRIERDLGWIPSITFEDGVTKMLELILDWKDAPVWDESQIEKATKKWFEYLA